MHQIHRRLVGGLPSSNSVPLSTLKLSKIRQKAMKNWKLSELVYGYFPDQTYYYFLSTQNNTDPSGFKDYHPGGGI